MSHDAATAAAAAGCNHTTRFQCMSLYPPLALPRLDWLCRTITCSAMHCIALPPHTAAAPNVLLPLKPFYRNRKAAVWDHVTIICSSLWKALDLHHRLNGSSRPVLTVTFLSYAKSKNSTPTESKPLFVIVSTLTHSQCDADNITFCDFCCFWCASFLILPLISV